MIDRSEAVAPAASQDATAPGSVPAPSRLDRAIWAVADLLRRHWLLGLLLAAGLVLRLLAQIGYEPALLYIDSMKYLFGTHLGTQFNQSDLGSYDPIGYSCSTWAGSPWQSRSTR